MTAILSGALALSACGSDSKTEADAGVKDSGAGNPDAQASTDAGDTPDSGRPDSGRPDTGVRDGGMGGGCAVGDEGCPCTPDPNSAQGNCAVGLSCIQWSQDGDTPVIASCIRECTMDSDCTGPGLSLCRPVIGSATGCVAQESPEGNDCNRSKRLGRTMSGCGTDLLCIGGLGDADQGSCGRPCGGTSGNNCQAPRAFCNPQVLNSTTTPGICTDRARGTGAVCSQTDITAQCDTTTTQDVGCIGLPDTADGEGVCMVFCDPTRPMNDCAATSSDPSHAPACKQVIASRTDVGVCSNDCSQFPDDCAGMGSLGNGQNCTSQLVFEQGGTPVSFCIDVQNPTFTEWDFNSQPAPCDAVAGDALRCPDGTQCIQVDQNGNSACLRGCSTTATVTAAIGCTTQTATVCFSINTMGPEGVCTPPQ